MVLLLMIMSTTAYTTTFNIRLPFTTCKRKAYLLSGYTTQNDTLTFRQAIYYYLLASSGDIQSGNHNCSPLYYVLYFGSTVQQHI